MMIRNIFLAIFIGTVICANAQQQNHPLPQDLFSFFCGKWHGEGQFSNGKSIAANLFIHSAPDSSWLMYEHTDEAPNQYKAISFWSVEKSSGQFLAYIFFNGQGHSQFDSDGWKDQKLVLTTHQFYPSGNTTRWQRFTYEKITGDSFKMTYEASSDGNVWKMGDYLMFTRLTK